MPIKRRQTSVPPSLWCLRDRDLLAAALQPKGRRFTPGPAVEWSPTTLRTVLSSYSCGLGWLRDRGILDWSLLPSERWPEDVLEAYITDVAATYAPRTMQSRLSGLERAIAILEPEADRSLIVAALKRLGKPPASPEKQRRVQRSTDLRDLGIDLMTGAEAGLHRSPRLIATLDRTGLQIALLSLRFWRISEFMLLEIGKHVAWNGDHWTMHATKPDTRSKRRFRSGRIPDILVPHLERYLDIHRPLLCNGKYEGDALWVSLRARPQSENSFRDNVRKFTGAVFDVALSPHDFRRSATTTMAIYNPAQIEAVSRMMGHSGPRTRDEAYNMASDFSASQQWAETRASILTRARDRKRLGRRHR